MRLLLAAAFCAGQLLHAAMPGFLPPDTKVLVGISVRGLKDSPILTGLGSDAKVQAAGLMAGSPLASLDFLKDLDSVIIASPGGQSENAPALIVVRGRFSPNLLPATGTPYHGVTLVEDRKKPNGTVALLDGETLLAGDAKLVRAAIDRRGASLALSPALLESVANLEARYDVWGIGEVPPGFAAKTGAAASAPPEIQAIDRFEFGASLRHGLELAGQIHVRTAKDADKIAQSMALIQAMVAMQQQQSSTGTKFDLQRDNATFRFSLRIPEEELKKGIAAQKAKFAGSASPAPGSIVKNDRGDAVTVTLPRK